MDRKIRNFALTFPVVIAILVVAVVVYFVVVPSGSNAGQQVGHADIAANPDVAVEEMVCAFDAWIGKTAEEAENALLALGHKVRVLGPNTPATMDHRPDRVNVLHDDQGHVIQVTCG